MSTLSAQLNEAREAGYTVVPHYGRFKVQPPSGEPTNAVYGSEIDAWAAVIAHHKRYKKAQQTDKIVVLGKTGNSMYAALITDVRQWRIGTVAHETPTQVHVEGPGFSYYNKKQNKATILRRFATVEAAQAWVQRCQDDIQDAQDDYVKAADAAQEAALRASELQRARNAAVMDWVCTEMGENQ